jgi:hypothetical protein
MKSFTRSYEIVAKLSSGKRLHATYHGVGDHYEVTVARHIDTGWLRCSVTHGKGERRKDKTESQLLQSVFVVEPEKRRARAALLDVVKQVGIDSGEVRGLIDAAFAKV